MGINNVAVKTFDSSGTQSLCRTNEYKGTEAVDSSFLRKCNKLYISGTGENVISGSLNKFPVTGSTDTFYINADSDAISEMILSVEFKFKSSAQAYDAYVSKDIILALINKIEIKIGNLTAQTITADDIYIRNITELGKACSLSAPLTKSTDGYGNFWFRKNDADEVIKLQASCSIPFIGRNSEMNKVFLQAGSLTNSIQVKVYYNNLHPSVGESSFQVIAGTDNTAGSATYLDLNYFKSQLKCRTHIMTSSEKNFINNNIVNRVLNTSSNITTTIDKNTNISKLSDSTTEVVIDLETISHNISHLLVAVRLPHVNDKTISSNGTSPASTYFDPNNGNHPDVVSATPFSEINYENTASTSIYDVYGYMPNAIKTVELSIGSNRTGLIHGNSALVSNLVNFNLEPSNSEAWYCISLSEKAFCPSGIQFSKTNYKKLIINLNNDIFNNQSKENALNSTNVTQKAIISVTACGTKVQTIAGGSTAFA